MASKGVAPKAKRKPKGKPKKAESQKAQSERFIETARKLGVDETGQRFTEVFGRIVPPKGGA